MKNKIISGLSVLLIGTFASCSTSGKPENCAAIAEAAGSLTSKGESAVYMSKGYALVSKAVAEQSPYADKCPSGCEYVGETVEKYCCWCPDE